METRNALRAANESGIPIAVIAKRINKDPSTIQKWLRGTSKYLSAETENEIILELKRIKEIWKNIDI